MNEPHSTRNLVLAADAAVDLQLHTVNSDGTWTPEDLIDYLIAEGFGLAAITDHERPEIAAEYQRLAAEKGLPILPAVEMTTKWRGGAVDVLCFGLDPELQDSALFGVAQEVLRLQQENTRQVLEGLRSDGYTFPDEAVSDLMARTSSMHLPQIMTLMLKHGHAADNNEAWERARKWGMRYASSEINVVVEAAHQDGAVALIAHPGRGEGYVEFDPDVLDQLREEIPIDGLEAYYPKHTPEKSQVFADYARKHGLLVSAGSDSHGRDHRMPIKYAAELCRDLLERLGMKVAL